MIFSESELVDLIKERDQSAYEALIKNYAKPIYFLVYKILNTYRSKEDIDECVSDVLLDIWLKIDDYTPEKGNFKTWIFMITKFKALRYKYKNDLNAIYNIDDFEVSEPISLEKVVIDRQRQKKLVDTIHTFNKTDKEIFIRRYFYGEKINDLIASLGLSRTAIDNRLFRGRNKIKEVLQNE